MLRQAPGSWPRLARSRRRWRRTRLVWTAATSAAAALLMWCRQERLSLTAGGIRRRCSGLARRRRCSTTPPTSLRPQPPVEAAAAAAAARVLQRGVMPPHILASTQLADPQMAMFPPHTRTSRQPANPLQNSTHCSQPHSLQPRPATSQSPAAKPHTMQQVAAASSALWTACGGAWRRRRCGMRPLLPASDSCSSRCALRSAQCMS